MKALHEITAARPAARGYAEKAGIEKRVHPHGLRHSFAANLANRGVPMHQIQKQLGHTSLATGGAYLDSIAPAETVAAVRDLDWNGDGESNEADDPTSAVAALRQQVEALTAKLERIESEGYHG